jgi:hypothetical protein
MEKQRDTLVSVKKFKDAGDLEKKIANQNKIDRENFDRKKETLINKKLNNYKRKYEQEYARLIKYN